jgi:hypothetical protein
MRACQFCGAAVEYIEPAAEESPQPETQAESQSQEIAPNLMAAVPLSNAAVQSSAKDTGRSRVKGKKGPIFFAVQVGLGLIFIAFLYFVVTHLTTIIPGASIGGGSSAGITPQNADSSSSVSTYTADQLGVDIYPGARAVSDGSSSSSPDGSVVSASFVTSDSKDKVIDFYKARMVGQTLIYASGDGVVISISPNPQESILVTIAPAQTGGKTRISISRTVTKS